MRIIQEHRLLNRVERDSSWDRSHLLAESAQLTHRSCVLAAIAPRVHIPMEVIERTMASQFHKAADIFEVHMDNVQHEASLQFWENMNRTFEAETAKLTTKNNERFAKILKEVLERIEALRTTI